MSDEERVLPQHPFFPSLLIPEYGGWRSRSVNPQFPGSSGGGGSSSVGRKTFSRSTNAQPVHGRVDWAAKYGGHR